MDVCNIIDTLTEKILPDRVAERVAVSSSNEDDEEKKWRKYAIFSFSSLLC
jgi:hypothetical protein